jgi:hypothetical protein
LLNAFGVQVEDNVSDYDSDSDTDMDEEDEEEADIDDVGDEVTAGCEEPSTDRDSVHSSDDELNPANGHNFPLRAANGRHLPQTAMDAHGSNIDRTSEPVVALSAKEYEDKEAEDMMRTLGRDEQPQSTSSHSPDQEMTDADPQPDQVPDAGDVGSLVLGRRARSDFESDLSPPADRGGGKRQRRGGA